MTSNLTEAEGLAKTLAENVKPEIIKHDGKEFLVAPQNTRLHDLQQLTQAYLPAPVRRTGTFYLGRTASLVEFANRYKHADSIIMGKGKVDVEGIDASVVVVFNPHPAGADNAAAGHADFQAKYQFPVSKELQKWFVQNGEGMDQSEFARFLEDRISDMTDPYMVEGYSQLEKVLGGKGADPITMLELSRGLEVRVNEQVKNQGRLQSGETQLIYSVEHADADGQPLKVPSWFLLNISVFEGDDPYMVPVRLRYRVRGGAVTWTYELFRIEKTFDVAFNDTLNKIQLETGLPLFIVA